jgi:hypothetical protein
LFFSRQGTKAQSYYSETLRLYDFRLYDFMSSEKLLVISSRDGSGILLCSDSGAIDIADSGTKRQLIRGCVLLIFSKKKVRRSEL